MNSTEEGPLWADYPNITYKVVNYVPIITLSNANVIVTLDVPEDEKPRTLIDISVTRELYPDVLIKLEGNNRIQCDSYGVGQDASAIRSNYSDVNICGSTTDDTLTIVTNNKGEAPLGGDLLYVVALTNVVSIRDCTLNFVLKEDKPIGFGSPIRYACIQCGIKFICDNACLNYSFEGNFVDEYTFLGIIVTSSFSSMSNTKVHVSPMDKFSNLSRCIDNAGSKILFDIYNCEIDAEIPNGKVFERQKAFREAFSITFHDYKSLTFYDADGNSKTISTGKDYDLAEEDYNATKFISEFKDVPVADNSTAVIATVFASALIAILAILVVLFRRIE